MQQIVSITSQGQISLPKLMLQDLGIYGSTKAIIQRKDNTILVTPRNDFWSLAGSLKSAIKLSKKLERVFLKIGLIYERTIRY